jgi:hypothetical protein
MSAIEGSVTAQEIKKILGDAEHRINMILLETSKQIGLPVEAETRDVQTLMAKGPASVISLRVVVQS